MPPKITSAPSAQLHYCFYWPGSWERNASSMRPRELGRELLQRGVRVSYLVDDVPYNRTHLNLDPAAEIHYVADPSGIKQFSRRRAILRKLQPDFVHVLNPGLKAYLTLAPLRSQKVVGDWDEWRAFRENTDGFVQRRMDRFLDQWLRRRAVLRIVCSRYMQQRFKEECGCSAHYIPYATYLQKHLEKPSPFSEPTAVYLGNFYKVYDQDLLFDAARILKAEGFAPPIVMIGGGVDLEKWREAVRNERLDNISILGFVPEERLWQCIRHAHVLLFPIRPTINNLSRCPSKVYAYAEARRPIITSPVGEVPAVLDDLPIYVPPTPEGFADALRSAMRAARLPDVNYGIERQNWGARAESLLAALASKSE